MKNGLACIHCWRKTPHSATRCSKCGSPISRTVSERFALDQLLSLRSDVATYKATDRREHRLVVGRILRPFADKPVKDCFAREARFLRVMAGAGPFPEFVDYDDLTSHRTVYSIAGYVHGTELPRAVRKYGPQEIMDVFFEVLSCVQKIHDKDLVCCNLKPEHILVTPEGEICLLDFKCVRKVGSHSHSLGCAGFKAPEQYVKRDPVSQSADVFALGCILYYLLTRRVPYPETMFGKTTFDKALTLPSDLCRYVTPELEGVLLKCLDLRPEHRYVNAGELQAALWTGFSGKTETGIMPIAATHSSKKAHTAEMPTSGSPPHTSFITESDKLVFNCIVGICIAVIIGAAVLAIMHLFEEVRSGCSPEPQYYYVPVQPVRERRESQIRVLSWPAANVFANGKLLSEAPSMGQVSCPSGQVNFRIVSKNGLERKFSTWLAPGKFYELRADLEDMTHSIKEVFP